MNIKLPEYGINTASHAHFRILGYTADQMREEIAKAVLAEREACAKLCEEMAEQTLAKQDGEIEQVDLNLRLIVIAGQKTCADAIRASGETPCS